MTDKPKTIYNTNKLSGFWRSIGILGFHFFHLCIVAPIHSLSVIFNHREVTINHLKNVKFTHRALGCVISKEVKFGKNCNVYQNVTIGADGKTDKYPVIGDNVRIYSHCVIVGDIKIGNNVIIGAGSFINKSIPDNCVVYTKKELIIKKNKKI